jgi:hypothetical protein
MSTTDSAMEVLRELLRLYDWRQEIGKRERDLGHRWQDWNAHCDGCRSLARDLSRYGNEKKAAWERARTVVEGEERRRCPFACSECGVYCEREASDPEHASSSHGAWCHCPGEWETTDSDAPPLVAATPESAPTCVRHYNHPSGHDCVSGSGCGADWHHPFAANDPATPPVEAEVRPLTGSLVMCAEQADAEVARTESLAQSNARFLRDTLNAAVEEIATLQQKLAAAEGERDEAKRALNAELRVHGEVERALIAERDALQSQVREAERLIADWYPSLIAERDKLREALGVARDALRIAREAHDRHCDKTCAIDGWDQAINGASRTYCVHCGSLSDYCTRIVLDASNNATERRCCDRCTHAAKMEKSSKGNE